MWQQGIYIYIYKQLYKLIPEKTKAAIGCPAASTLRHFSLVKSSCSRSFICCIRCMDLYCSMIARCACVYRLPVKYVFVCLCVCVCMCMRACVCLCMRVYVSMCDRMCACVWVCMCVCLWYCVWEGRLVSGGGLYHTTHLVSPRSRNRSFALLQISHVWKPPLHPRSLTFSRPSKARRKTDSLAMSVG
jgi:hypothetical protein